MKISISTYQNMSVWKAVNKYNHDYFKNFVFFGSKKEWKTLINFRTRRKFLTPKFRLMLSILFFNKENKSGVGF